MPDVSERFLHGISAAPGICIGKAYLVDTEGVEVVPSFQITPEALPEELKRFKAAVRKAADELRRIIENTPESLRSNSGILETHLILLKDKMLYEKALNTIESERVNAEWALKTVVSNLKEMFNTVSDPYLKERVADITHVSDRIMCYLIGLEPVSLEGIDKRVILVAHDLSPAQASQIQLERIRGFITDRGGRTSHTSIIARSLGIPAVQGLGQATRWIKNDDIIVVDGTTGQVIVNPSEETLIEYQEREARYESYKAAITRESQLGARSTDGCHIEVMGNIELPEEVVSVLDNGGDGIGLYRTEFQYLSRPRFPDEAELFDKYRDVVEVMAPRPVTIRTLDINGDKIAVAENNQGQYNHRDEANPALGLRAIRYCLQHPAVFTTQLRAILRAAAFGTVRILLPMISSCEEVLAARRLLENAADELKAEGLPLGAAVEMGIMIEVPSAVILADILAEAVDFFSIGTNDLIQYALATDRSNRHVAHLYQPLHPAITRLLKQVTDAAHARGIRVFMCGEMAGDPIYTPLLLGLGIDELSMTPYAIPAVKRIIRQLAVADAREFVTELLTCKTTADSMALLEQRYGGLIPELAGGFYNHAN